MCIQHFYCINSLPHLTLCVAVSTVSLSIFNHIRLWLWWLNNMLFQIKLKTPPNNRQQLENEIRDRVHANGMAIAFFAFHSTHSVQLVCTFLFLVFSKYYLRTIILHNSQCENFYFGYNFLNWPTALRTTAAATMQKYWNTNSCYSLVWYFS